MDEFSYSETVNVGRILKSEIDLSELNDEAREVTSLVMNFCSTLKRLKDKGILINLEKNISSLNVVLHFNDSTLDYSGMYDYYCNAVLLDYNFIHNAIYHELFHMASSDRRDGFCGTGFLKIKGDDVFFNGLNEGYTDLMAERYFEEEGFYEIEKDLVFLLEKIAGNKKMEKFYYETNVDGLILELSKYNLTSSILEFLRDLDFVSSNIEYDDNGISDKLYHMGKFLISTYFNKESMLYEQGTIDRERFIYDMAVFIALICKYNILNKYEAQTILLDTLEFEDYTKCLSLSKKM